MSKRIVFCADGTWDDSASQTNVYRLFNALPTIAGEQITFYDDGVGSDGNPIQKLAGGAMGDGLFQKIKDGYTRIASVYDKGDEIFIFGFSRGAYTARSLAGMIADCGLPSANPDAWLTETAFQAYRNRGQRSAILSTIGPAYAMTDATITMLGVWDTVGALGLPAIFGGVDPLVFGFLDTGLHPDVQNAFHAVSIDERRREFPATLWTSAPAPGQTMRQVYFSGVHCDVGGGNAPDASTGTALSDITLSWMMNNAKNLGLTIAPAMLARYGSVSAASALDAIHESWSVIWGIPNPRTVASNATLANSVPLRCTHDASYRPANLTLVNGTPGPTYQIAQVVT